MIGKKVVITIKITFGAISYPNQRTKSGAMATVGTVCLANGEVTVCNYNLASGDTDAVAFGLFFLLSFNNAVLSRPGNENTRIPHFFYVDELPVLIHPSL